MPITAKELREKRAKLIRDARSIFDKAEAENRQPTAEERQQWARIMGDVGPDGKRVDGEEERLKRQIDDLDRQEAAEGELKQRLDTNPPGRENRTPPANGEPPVPDPESDPGEIGIADMRRKLSADDRAYAIQAWFRTWHNEDLTPRHQQALTNCQRARDCYIHRGDFVINMRLDYRRMRRELGPHGLESRAGANAAQSINIGPSGAYTIPEGFVNALEVALLQYGGIREVADVIRTTSGNDLPWPTVNDTTVKGAIIQNNAQITAADVSFGAIVLHAYKYTSQLVLVPVELIEDSAFNLAEMLGELLGIRLGRITADHFTFGTGAGQPTGIITAATLGVTGASTSALAADDLYTLKHSVDPAYRKGAGFMLNDQILLALKKLKDGQGRYLWQAGLAGGVPDMIDNDPITINQSMDSTIASGKKTVAYGLLSKYKIRDVSEVRLRRLVERYADQDQEGFVMFYRGDGNLIDAGTHPVKYMTH
jgi:HK97 family phage major capsid protein